MVNHNVAYVVYTMDSGHGGHIHSLKVISESYSDNSKVIYIGYTKPKVDFDRMVFIDLNNTNHFECVFILFKETKGFDILHAFNEHSFALARVVSIISNIKIVLNKCGGKNTRYYPNSKSLVVFSHENKVHFDTLGKRKYRNTYLIPNRVEESKKEKTLPALDIDNSSFNIVCITRISNKYREKIYKSIELTKKLIALGYNVKLTIIGNVHETNSYEELIREIDTTSIRLYTDDAFTTNAKRYIPLFDLTISAGRSLMESFSFGVPSLSISSVEEFPILINEDTFTKAFYYNFSERINFVYGGNLERIIKLIEDNKYYDEMVEFSKNYFNDYFSCRNIFDKYNEVYSNATSESIFNLPDILLNVSYIYWLRREIDLSRLKS